MNTKILHSANISKVRTALRSTNISTKNTLSQRTMLSVATCGAILNEMIRVGEVKEISLDKPSGGRPARRFVYNFDFSSILLMNIIHNPLKTIHFKLINSEGTTISTSKVEMVDITIDDIIHYINTYKNEVPNLKVVGLSIPGVVKDGHVYNCDIEPLKNTNLVSQVFEVTQIPIVMENDVNLAALCYNSSFKQDTPEVISYLYHPEKSYPGLGIVVNDKVLRGKNNFGGEVMHLFVNLEKFNKLIEKFDKGLFLDIFMSELHAITSILAPEHLVISGHFFTKEMIDIIQEKMNESMIKDQYPKLIIDRDMNNSIMLGLQQETISHLDELLKELYHD